jgi:His-Xaa-Ser system protein HxsD
MKTITVDTNIYSLRSIFSTAYIFLDDFYIFLDQPQENKVTIEIKSKDLNCDLDEAVGRFKNELINTSLRLKISEDNKKIRELIVSSALYGKVENLPKKQLELDDPEGICRPWEDVHCKNTNIHKAVNKNTFKSDGLNYVKMFKCEKKDGDKN